MMRFLWQLMLLPLRICHYFYYKCMLGGVTWSTYIDRPLEINGGKNIFLGNRASIHYKTWLAAKPFTGEVECKLIIKDGCTIGHFNHIYATKSIILHENVLTADKVYISDNLHGYEEISIPILKQSIRQIGTVEIGEGSWLGENVCVIGANIGKHCVIGANSVVTKDIPDYCVAVGAPAMVIRHYDFEKKEWVKTKKEKLHE